jgi:hypothetical protein
MTLRDRFAETHALRRSMLNYVTSHPRSAGRIFTLLRAEWGEVGERRLWRVLRWLLAQGAIVRVGCRYHSDGYVRGGVSRLPRSRVHCSRCETAGHNVISCTEAA